MYYRCYLCGEEVETINHLFLQCRITSQLWRIFISLRGFAWAMPNKITHLLYSWGEVGVGAADRDRWRIVPACIWWTVWKERNARCFESKNCDLQKIKLNCIRLFCASKFIQRTLNPLQISQVPVRIQIHFFNFFESCKYGLVQTKHWFQ